jgi:Zn-dependent protease
MGWQDRDYSREHRSAGSPLMWLLTGTVPMFTAFGIRVQAHASMIVYAVLVLLAGLGPGFTWQDRVTNITMLFAIVLLHEFGHCFAARWVGGSADQIVMHPLGGLALTDPPRRPMPTFLTVAAGPAVNLLICLLCALVLLVLTRSVPWKPFWFVEGHGIGGWTDVAFYAYWIYQVSWMLLLFNLLPIFPLDGGQMLQTAMWPKLGYYKSMMVSCRVGMIGAGIGMAIALLTLQIGLAILALCGFLYCMQLRRQLVAAGGEFAEDESIDLSAAYEVDPEPKKPRVSGWKLKRVQKQLAREAAERRAVDEILAKLSAQGAGSLTWRERRTLKLATRHLRSRDAASKAAADL